MTNDKNIKLIAKWSFMDSVHANAYSDGRNEVLIANGFESIVTQDTSWHKEKNTLLLVAYKDKLAVAGMRIDVYDPKLKLPFVFALNKKYKQIESLLEIQKYSSCGEIGGVWNAKKISKVNLAHVLARYSLALCQNIGVETAFTFNATYTSKLSSNYGAELISELGEDGLFAYPFPPFFAGLWLFESISRSISIDKQDQDRINYLSKNPNAQDQSERELVPLIDYNFTPNEN